MKIKTLFSIYLFFIFVNKVNAQPLIFNSYVNTNRIEKVKLSDSFLLHAIDSASLLVNKNDSIFKQKGYWVIHLKGNLKIDSISCGNSIYLTYSYTNLSKEGVFPKYYSYHQNKLILIFDETIAEFSQYNEKYKRGVLKKINPFLVRPQFVYAYKGKRKIKLKNLGNDVRGFGFYICYPKELWQAPFIYKSNYN